MWLVSYFAHRLHPCTQANHGAVAAQVNSLGFLQADDGVDISSWAISIGMVASTAFFGSESRTVGNHWKASLLVDMLVALLAAVHYFYMREYWLTVKQGPAVPRSSIVLCLCRFSCLCLVASTQQSNQNLAPVCVGVCCFAL